MVALAPVVYTMFGSAALPHPKTDSSILEMAFREICPRLECLMIMLRETNITIE